MSTASRLFPHALALAVAAFISPAPASAGITVDNSCVHMNGSAASVPSHTRADLNALERWMAIQAILAYGVVELEIPYDKTGFARACPQWGLLGYGMKTGCLRGIESEFNRHIAIWQAKKATLSDLELRREFYAALDQYSAELGFDFQSLVYSSTDTPARSYGAPTEPAASESLR